MIKVGIVGATGYTGVELLRLLAKHPNVKIKMITSRAEHGLAVVSLFPNLRGSVDVNFTSPNVEQLKKCDVVFFATPNGTAMKMVPALLDAGVRIIDLAADFRLKDSALWQKWYGIEHSCPELLDTAVYGLPEVNREQIKAARLVANPGCYPTAVQLGLLPLVETKLADLKHIVADVKSGVSGAGRGANVGNLMAEMGESFKAYAVSGHRHLPEIQQGLQAAAQESVALTFVPHLLPMIRGIHATLYATVVDSSVDLQQLYESRYQNELFVDVLPAGEHPETRYVRGSNMCRISVFRPQGDETVVILSVIDNLVKGASGQAVQNMNLMFELAEDTGLDLIALMP
ncbi:N-acetyl-gamma-glutamyl-phosphate reductase [hydrothermal vent metagenome]|uniref:N-acetyl-gamma-glutamyl-phosphate reductase n=1 Tax=hydrothermal vent metagenome TaxID=652676 RepID=A0A3B1B741_9ZZZZ